MVHLQFWGGGAKQLLWKFRGAIYDHKKNWIIILCSFLRYHVHISNGNKITGAYSEAETKKATIKLLRTIVVLTQTLKPLPDDVMMTMKLLYYDNGQSELRLTILCFIFEFGENFYMCMYCITKSL